MLTCTDALSMSATACWSSGVTVTFTFGGPPVCAWSSPPPSTTVLTAVTLPGTGLPSGLVTVTAMPVLT
jgi:hypothetical protein